MKIYSAILFFTIAAMFSSTRDSVPEPNPGFALGDTLLIDYKESLHNFENDISVKFDSLLSDSRCPIDVVCFWAGNAEVKIDFETVGKENNLFLNTHYDFGKDTVISGFRVSLLDVYPYKLSDSTYAIEDHQIKLVINKTE